MAARGRWSLWEQVAIGQAGCSSNDDDHTVGAISVFILYVILMLAFISIV